VVDGLLVSVDDQPPFSGTPFNVSYNEATLRKFAVDGKEEFKGKNPT